MGTKRRIRQTAQKPLTREQLDRYAVADLKTWPELVKLLLQLRGPRF